MPKSTGRKKKKREAEQRERGGTRGGRNIGEIERAVSTILGGTLLIGGLSRRSLPGFALAATGAAFLYRGATGHCKVYESLGLNTYRNAEISDRSIINETHEIYGPGKFTRRKAAFLETGGGSRLPKLMTIRKASARLQPSHAP